MLGLTYNTMREKLLISEYGRNIHSMIEYAKTVEDDEKRNNFVKEIINTMGIKNPQLKFVEEYNHKLWDHLFILSKGELKYTTPYPFPKEELKTSENNSVPKLNYNTNKAKYSYYGNNIIKVIEFASTIEDKDKLQLIIENIVNQMKKSFMIWNNDHVDDEVLSTHLIEMSNGKLSLSDFSNINDYKKINKLNVKSNYKTNKNIKNKKHTYRK